jgi:metal-responsive CopG/Arc/MetJ family transcriptional regulator
MPKEKGLNREQITFKCTAATVAKIDSYIGEGELTSRNEVIRHALQYYFDSRDQPNNKEQFKEWLLSKEGETFVKDIIRKSQD